jgi:benzoylformate decarboxylase
VGDAIIADVRSAAQALLAAAKPTQRPAPPPRAPIPDVEHAETPLKPATLWAAVGHAAPADTLWVSEAGSNELAITTAIRPGNPVSHLTAAGEGLGFGLPAAVGAQLAAPDRPVVALMGDGSMHYAITALWTAAHYQIPVTIVVASNAEYGILKEFGKWEKTAGVPGMDLPGLDVVGTAASYGVDAHEAHTTDEVIKLVESGIADRERPTLINARTTPVDA